MLYKAIIASIKNRKVTLFTVIVLALFGVFSYQMAPKQEAPEINIPIAVLTTVFPGASPEDVNLLVTSKIEDEVSTLNGFDYSTSTSVESVSIVVVRLNQTADTEKAWADLRQKMNSLQQRLPQGVNSINVNTRLGETAGFILANSNDTNDNLVTYAEKIKKELQRISGVSRIDIIGEQIREITVKVDMDQLQHLPLTLENITQIIAGQNVMIPAGSIQEEEARIQVKIPGAYASVEDIGNTILFASQETGMVLRLNDIAEVEVEPSDASLLVNHNGKNSILLAGYFQEHRNIVHVGAEVDTQLQELSADLPLRVQVDYAINQPADVKQAVNQFLISLFQGMLFVIIVVFIGLGMRNALVVSAVIPLSILTTLGVMSYLKIEIHQISITALIISLGLLVDNAIVVSDSIQVKIDKGIDRLQACVDGVREVAIPVGTSTLTTICAFLPLLLLPSVAGEYIRSLPQIVMISLSASYVIALFVIPTLAYMFFKKSKPSTTGRWVRSTFMSSVKTGMRWRFTSIVLLIGAITVAGFLVNQLGLQFFPKADKKIIHIDIFSERSGDIAYTQQLATEIESVVKDFHEVSSYTTIVGADFPRFFNSAPMYMASQDFAQILLNVDLEQGTYKKNTELVEAIKRAIDEQVKVNRKGTENIVLVNELEQAEPIGAPVRLRVYGDDMEQLYKAAEDVKILLATIEGTINVDHDIPTSTDEYYIDVDTDAASLLGLSKFEIQREVSYALRGKEASIFRLDGSEYPIIVKGNIVDRESLEGIAVSSAVTGNKVVLRDIAQVSLRKQLPAIKKYDRDYSLTVFSDVKSGYSPVKIQEQLQEKLSEIDLGNVGVAFDGEREKINENFGDIGNSAMFAVLLIYGVLLLQFRSFSQPLIILLTIPMSAVGSIYGLYLFKQPLSFTALLGLVSLFGIVVNNAIVLIDFINREREHHASILAACYEAVDKRLRPILLSTITTTMGLMPLVLTGSELFRPLSISIMSGLVVSTFLTLIVIPIFYGIVESWFETKKSRKLAYVELKKEAHVFYGEMEKL